MKSNRFYLIIVAAVLLSAACSGPKSTLKIQTNGDEQIVSETDSVEHELETFDTGFENWYLLQNNPSQYRSESFYETWNMRYVTAWNENANNPAKNSFFQPIIGWNPTTNYEFELDHELFYYFKYVEDVLGIQIMEGGPESVSF